MIVRFENCKKKTIEGTVKKIRDGELTAIFKLDWEEESVRSKCSIKFAPNDTVFKRKNQALKKLEYLNNDLKEMLCRRYPKKQKIPNINLRLPRGYDFNSSQEKAIRMAVSNPFSLIQGPPGTGKTHTIGAIAIQALRNEPNKKVLICGTTNVSINSLLEIVGDMVQGEGFQVCWPAASSRDFLTEDDITKEQKLLTLYKSCHMNSNESRRFKELREKHELTEQEVGEMEELRERLEIKIIHDSNVIFSTLDSSGKKTIVNSIGKISTLIVDEATLSVESSMIIPLSLLPERFILVGDHKQLGPSPKFDELKKLNYYYSMFERIIREKSCLKNSVMLNTQYRMHTDISLLPNGLFYNDELIDDVDPEKREISKNFIFQKHFNFININGEEEKNGTSYTNDDEIIQVTRFVNSLVDSGVDPSQIGVISAYGAQTHLLSDHFKVYGPRVKVSTIDSFQGSQKDYIIICTTRNGTDIGFLNDERRMNVAITRARCLVAIFGNEETLSQSFFWNVVIEYAKYLGSFYSRLPIKIEKQKLKSLIISKKTDNVVRDLVYEFKEEIENAGYKLRKIDSKISDSEVRVLWPDETEDVEFLREWVDKRVKILDDDDNVTLSYDAEGVCMQFGDIFDKEVDYYNWEQSESEFPEIKTNESIIISFYQHKGSYDLNPILVETMKPLLEHPKITLITFDFTFDFDKLYDYGIKLKTKRIIDSQLMIMPEQSGLNEHKDLICSTGWKSISEYIKQAMENNINANIICRAKESVRKGNKQFPHNENHFLVSQFNYPHICKFTTLFLEYSAADIFYTAVVGIDVLSRGVLDFVKERSLKKFDDYLKYRTQYKRSQHARNAYYVRESFTSVIQAEFSKDNQTYQILSYFKKLDSFVNLLNECPELLNEIIPGFNHEDEFKIRQRFDSIVDIMKNQDNVHLGNIKDKACLAHVHGIQKKGAFVLRVEEKVDEVFEELKQEDKVKEDKLNKERTAIQEITGGKNSFKSISDSPWSNIDISVPMNINDLDKFPKTHAPFRIILRDLISIRNSKRKGYNQARRNPFITKSTTLKNPKRKSDEPIEKEDIKNVSDHNSTLHNKTHMKDKNSEININSNRKFPSLQEKSPETYKHSDKDFSSLQENNSIYYEETNVEDKSPEAYKHSDSDFPSLQENNYMPKKANIKNWLDLDTNKKVVSIKDENKIASKNISEQINSQNEENRNINEQIYSDRKTDELIDTEDNKNLSNHNSVFNEETNVKDKSPEAYIHSDNDFPNIQNNMPKKSNIKNWPDLDANKKVVSIKDENRIANNDETKRIYSPNEENSNTNEHIYSDRKSDELIDTEDNNNISNYNSESYEETNVEDKSPEAYIHSNNDFPSLQENNNMPKRSNNKNWLDLGANEKDALIKDENKVDNKNIAKQNRSTNKENRNTINQQSNDKVNTFVPNNSTNVESISINQQSNDKINTFIPTNSADIKSIPINKQLNNKVSTFVQTNSTDIENIPINQQSNDKVSTFVQTNSTDIESIPINQQSNNKVSTFVQTNSTNVESIPTNQQSNNKVSTFVPKNSTNVERIPINQQSNNKVNTFVPKNSSDIKSIPINQQSNDKVNTFIPTNSENNLINQQPNYPQFPFMPSYPMNIEYAPSNQQQNYPQFPFMPPYPMNTECTSSNQQQNYPQFPFMPPYPMNTEYAPSNQQQNYPQFPFMPPYPMNTECTPSNQQSNDQANNFKPFIRRNIPNRKSTSQQKNRAYSEFKKHSSEPIKSILNSNNATHQEIPAKMIDSNNSAKISKPAPPAWSDFTNKQKKDQETKTPMFNPKPINSIKGSSYQS